MFTDLHYIVIRSLMIGIAVTTLLIVGIGIGSQNLLDYDPALVIYTLGTLISAFVVTCRVSIFFHRAPTRRYVSRGFELLFSRNFFSQLLLLGKSFADHFGTQRFIFNRGVVRWIGHFLISWGTILSFAVTIPLVFGWVHFKMPIDAPDTYAIYSFGIQVGSFTLESLKSFLIFNALNISAVMVIIGVVTALNRRLYTTGRSKTRQQFGHDLVPLIILLSVSATGLMLTYSTHALEGYGYAELSLIHALTVMILMIYLPFGKLFHLFVRPLHLAVELHHKADEKAPPALCRVCGDGYAGAMHVQDLKDVLEETGLGWKMDEEGFHYADVCPGCRRRLLGASQAKVLNSRKVEEVWHTSAKV
jgi:hypothetical protein